MRIFPAILFSLFSLVAVATGVQAGPRPFKVQPYASFTIDGWSLLEGGVGTGQRDFGLIELGAGFVLTGRLEGHIGGFLYPGDRDVDGFTGDFGVYSNIRTDTRYNIFTAWLQHSFTNSYIRIGQLASDENFYVSEGGSLFLNSNFGALPSVSANLSAPLFSVGAAGAEYQHQLANGYFQIGVYAGDPGPGDRDDHGFKWKAGGDAGYFYIAERGWQFYGNSHLEAQVKIGAYFHSGSFESFTSGSYSKGNSALYAVIDQSLSESVSLFARIGINPESEYSIIDRYFDIGFNWQGVIGSRPEDIFGIAYSHSHFGEEFRKATAIAENRPVKSEQVVEITYQSGLIHGWQLQPSLQYIINPFHATKDVVVAGIRLSVDY